MRNPILLLAMGLLAATHAFAPAQTAVAPPAEMSLIDLNSPEAQKQVAPAKGIPVGSTITVDKNGITVNFTAWQKGDADHPGLQLTPADGKAWDLSAFGHVEANITNTGTAGLNIVMHVVPTGEGPWTERNLEAMQIKPGETKTIKVIFGYAKGYKPVAPPAFTPASVTEIYFYHYHSTQPHSFRIGVVKAAGTAGEKPDLAAPPSH